MKRRVFVASALATLAGCGGGTPDELDDAQEGPQTAGSAKQRFEGVLRQPHRATDRWFDASQVPAATAGFYDFRNALPPIGDEGPLNSCVGFAEAAQVATLYPGLVASAMFVWDNARITEGTLDKNVGVSPGDAMDALAIRGACHDSLCRYNERRWRVAPTTAAYQDGRKYLAPHCLRLASLQDMTACIASGFAFSFTVPVLKELLNAMIGPAGIIAMPDAPGPSLGLHRLLAVGMDVANARFLVRNSWGLSWGMSGYAWMPFAWVDGTGALALDHMTLRKA